MLSPNVPFALHEWLYRRNYQTRQAQGLPCPAWVPSGEDIEQSHVGQWMRRHGFERFEDLHEWSVTQVEAFGDAVTKALSIRFAQRPTKIHDLDGGIEHVQWYPGAKLNIVESCFQADDNAIALIHGDDANRLETLTYGQLKANVARVANGLRAAGVRPGDRVALSMPMTTDAIAIFLGIIAVGAAAVTIAESFSTEEIAVRLRITQPRLMFVQDQITRNGKSHPFYAKVADQPGMTIIVLPENSNREQSLRGNDRGWTDFLSDDRRLRCDPRAPGDETTILFSSGTTGQPKAIPWDHTTPIKSAADAYFHQDVHPTDVLCWPTNLGWMMGPWLVYAALINRATIAVSSCVPTGRPFCEFVMKAKVSMLGLVPSIVSQWRKGNAIEGLDWTAIRLFSSTGECSNANDMLWLMSRARYRPMIEYCGGTEVGGGYVSGILTKPAVPGMFSAKALGSDWMLLDEKGSRQDVGEVFLVPPSLGLSTRLLNRDHHEVYYAELPIGPNGQLLRRHGDQMEALAEGYFRADGRVDDAMNLGGIKVSCVQIEELLSQHPEVQHVAACAVPPTGGGPDRLILFVGADARTTLSTLQTELQQMIKRNLNPLFKIHDVRRIDQLPRTASNKIMRRELRQIYLQESRE
ncbi:MAG: AMP-binding protein [Pirellulaceae bacterium]